MTDDTDSRDGAPLRGAAAASWWWFAAGGVLAAAVAVAGNLAWRAAFPSTFGEPVPDAIDSASVTTATALSVLLAAGIYLLLARGLRIATPLYIVGSIVTAAASCVATFTPFLPDGRPAPASFPTLAIPMHMIAGLSAAIVVPIVVLVGARLTARRS
jgi:hypothetical protein